MWKMNGAEIRDNDLPFSYNRWLYLSSFNNNTFLLVSHMLGIFFCIWQCMNMRTLKWVESYLLSRANGFKSRCCRSKGWTYSPCVPESAMTKCQRYQTCLNHDYSMIFSISHEYHAWKREPLCVLLLVLRHVFHLRTGIIASQCPSLRDTCHPPLEITKISVLKCDKGNYSTIRAVDGESVNWIEKMMLLITTSMGHRISLKWCLWLVWRIQGLYSLTRRRLISIGIPIINLRRSSDRLRFIMGIPIPVRRRLLSE